MDRQIPRLLRCPASLQLLCASALTAISCLFGSAANAQQNNTAFHVPLHDRDAWQILQYSSLPANDVKFDSKGLLIRIDSSASPLIYPLQPRKVNAVIFSIEIDGDLNLGDVAQGTKAGDDFLFRLGLVYEGEHRLNFLQRHFAPEWITTLHKLAPKDSGIDRIQFYNVYSDPQLTNKRRQHPLSELVYENFRFAAPKSGRMSGKIRTRSDKRVVALWISSDGDDTDSRYQIRIREIILQ